MKTITKLILAGALLLLIAACASAPTPVAGPAAEVAVPQVYEGSGRDASLLTAINRAKMDAVRNAVIALVGSQAEAANQELLEDRLYSTRNPNQYVFPESMETLRRENLGTVDAMDMVYEITIRVQLDVVRTFLETNGIRRGQGAGGQNESAGSDEQGNGSGARSLIQSSPSESANSGGSGTVAPQRTAEESRFIENYLNNLSYMVYFPETSEIDSFIMSSAVTQANSWLAGSGYRVVDPNQIEELKADGVLIYEEQTGGEIGILAWIAQRLNADVYIEIDARASTRADGNRYYAQAILALKMFETSTGRLLGSVPYSSPETFSRSSEDEALANALQSSVFQAMPVVEEQSRIQLGREVENGIRYDLVFLNTSDTRLMSRFRSELRETFRDVETISQSPEETRYAVYHFGRNDEVEDLIYRVADRTPGLEFLTLVLTRGKSLTFDTDL